MWLLQTLLVASVAGSLGTAPLREINAPPLRRTGLDLVSVARASPRPAECMPQGPDADRLWQAARAPHLGSYCAALARGYALLRTDPAAALQASKEAQGLDPSRMAQHVLAARALLSLDRVRESWDEFQRAGAPERLVSPAAVHDYARAARRVGEAARALAAYRLLAPRAHLIPDANQRQQIYIEAGVAAMSVGPEGLAAARAFLAEGRRQKGVVTSRALGLGALALALDRDGRSSEAQGLAQEAGGPWTLLAYLPDSLGAREAGERTADPLSAAEAPEESPPEPPLHVPRPSLPASFPLLPEEELQAIVAILAETEAPVIAQDCWRGFIASVISQDGGDPARSIWLTHARDKLSKLAPGRQQTQRGDGRAPAPGSALRSRP